MMTPKEVRQLWVKALRSGEYQQGKKYLKTNDGKYCCLGVLTDLAVKNEVIQCFVGNGGGIRVLCPSVQDWAGLKDEIGSFEDGWKALSSMNDSNTSFATIADTIEAEPKGLCV